MASRFASVNEQQTSLINSADYSNYVVLIYVKTIIPLISVVGKYPSLFTSLPVNN